LFNGCLLLSEFRSLNYAFHMAVVNDDPFYVQTLARFMSRSFRTRTGPTNGHKCKIRRPGIGRKGACRSFMTLRLRCRQRWLQKVGKRNTLRVFSCAYLIKWSRIYKTCSLDLLIFMRTWKENIY